MGRDKPNITLEHQRVSWGLVECTREDRIVIVEGRRVFLGQGRLQ